MSDKYTAGPWVACEFNGPGMGWKVGPAWIGGNPGSLESAANARLIHAAPTMLTALRRASLALAFAAESSSAMRDDYEAVSAAIAAATGAT